MGLQLLKFPILSSSSVAAAETTTATFLVAFVTFSFYILRLFNNWRVVLRIREDSINFVLQISISLQFAILVFLTIMIYFFLVDDIEVAQFIWFVTNIFG